MIVVLLLVVGLCLGSFVNATVWRLHEQEESGGKNKPDKKYLARLSIMRGRSMCTHCHHELAPKDLVPLFSWVSLKGKCRYCDKAIGDNPLVEATLPLLFVASYIWWPVDISGAQMVVFGLLLLVLTGLLALLVYDLRWMLLPDRLMYPLMARLKYGM